MTATLDRVVSPLDFGEDFDPCTPENHVSPSRKMREELESQHKIVRQRESQIRRLRKCAELLKAHILSASLRATGDDPIALNSTSIEDKLLRLQSALQVIATGVENNSLPSYLQCLDSKGVIECVVNNAYPMDVVIRTALNVCQINNRQDLHNTHEALEPYLWKRSEEEQYIRDVHIKTLHCRRKLLYMEYETPKPIAGRMVFAAGITKGQTILEPSAGVGTIADLILEWENDVTLHVVEKVSELQELLTFKKLEVIPIDDFLDADFNVAYDRIVMSPPWDQGADMQHVMVAAELLNPGGRLVALVSQKSLERKDHKGKLYRSWIENTNTSTVVIPLTEFNKMYGTNGVMLIYNRKA